jgi:hypothetical protein
MLTTAEPRLITTFSMWNLFRNCRKACEWRYVHDLVPIDQDENLSFGTVVHECLKLWHETRDLPSVLALIDESYPTRMDREQNRQWHLATAIAKGYAKRYAKESFSVVELEKQFVGPIVNPDNESESSGVLAGKVDGIVRMDKQYWLIEHKTASVIDAAYLDRLWMDLQVSLYQVYIERELKCEIAGVIYNVIGKAKLQQSAGETPEEFAQRREELLAKSKTGKTTAKQQVAETDEEYQERLAEKYSQPEMFHRHTLLLSRDQLDTTARELWQWVEAYRHAVTNCAWMRNDSCCYRYGRPCAYLPLCNSNGNPIVASNLYQKLPPHEELKDNE